MMDFGGEKTSLVDRGINPDWFVIDFCQLGFIGKVLIRGCPLMTSFNFVSFLSPPPVFVECSIVTTVKNA